jgi:hypothetical protein
MNQTLFLDFDGVLHPTDLVVHSPFNRVELLEEALHSYSPQIVISSSWRFTHSFEKLQKLLPNSISKLMIGTTGSPIIGQHARYKEILAFLSDQSTSSDWRALRNYVATAQRKSDLKQVVIEHLASVTLPRHGFERSHIQH